MADCTDKRFLDMHHAYELGLLAKKDTEEFELHLYECQYCFDSVQHFKQEAAIIRDDPGLKERILKVAGLTSQEAGTSGETPVRVGKPLWKSLLPTSLAAAAVLVLLILQPWQIEIRTTESYAEDRLAVMYFENLTDPDDSQRTGEIVTNLLITDLSESQYVQVVSTRRLNDLLRILNRTDKRVLDRDAAKEVAVEARVRWMLLGSVSQSQSGISLAGHLIDVHTGEVVASQFVGDTAGADLFSLVDSLTVRVKGDMALPAEALEEYDPSVADVTTHSPEAYRLYLEGLDFADKFYVTEAKESFERALAIDTTFAIAYFRLSKLNTGRQRIELMDKAVQFCDRVSNVERLYIKAEEASIAGNDSLYRSLLVQLTDQYPDEKEAYLMLGTWEYGKRNLDRAIELMIHAVELDPTFKTAHNQLAYIYADAGDFANAITSINKYIELAPDEANPYDSRGDLYASFGDLERARESYRQALTIKPDYLYSLLKLGHMYTFNRDYSLADSCYLACSTAGEKSFRSMARKYRSYIPVHQGRLQEALQVLDEGIEAEQNEGVVDGQISDFRNLKASIHVARGEYDLAVDELVTAMEDFSLAYPGNETAYRSYYGQALAASGDYQKAEEVFEDFKKALEDRKMSLLSYYAGLGAVELSRGNTQEAVRLLEQADEISSPSQYFGLYATLGRAYLQSGRISDAVRVLERQASIYEPSRLYAGLENVKLHYYLGRAYEESRWYDQAIEQYETFLAIWKDADPGIAEIDDARERLASLRSSS